MQVPMASQNGYMFQPTFPSDSHALLKHPLYTKPVLGMSNTKLTKTQSVPSTQSTEKKRHVNQRIVMPWGQCTERSPTWCRECKAETVIGYGRRKLAEVMLEGHSKTNTILTNR